MRKIDSNSDKEIEKSVEFLINASPKESEKPVILHSIRVGLYLYEKGYEKDIIIAGFLHDLLEDSDTSYKDIENEFGNKVAKLVQANSFDKDIPGNTVQNKKKRYQQTLNHCLKVGKPALIIKAADILDNSYYYHLAPEKLKPWLLYKIKNFIDKSSPIINKEIVWENLNKQCQFISEKYA